MVVGAMNQPDTQATRSVVMKNAYSPGKHYRIHSEPENLRYSRSWSNADHGRPETRSLELPSKLRSIRHLDKVAQPKPFDDSTVASCLGGDAVATVDDGSFDSPICRNPGPRVVQRMVLLDESVLKDQNLLNQIHDGGRERDGPAHQTATTTDREVELSSPRRGNMSGPGPGPGPGPGRGPTKKSLPLLIPQSDSTPQQQLEWSTIRKLRQQVWSLRVEVQHRRRVLRMKQQTKSVAEDRFLRHVMGYMHPKNTNQSSEQQESTSAFVQEFQRARDEYGPLEDDCIMLEDELNRNELNLMHLEEYFYQQMSPHDMQTGVEDPDLSSTISDSPTESGCSDEVTEEHNHPLVTQFLSKMGDVDILEERLANSREEKYILEDTKEVRLRVGLALPPDDQEWLDQFDATEADILQELKLAEAEAQKLRKTCFDYGLVDEVGDPSSIQSWVKRNFSEEDDLEEFTRFPALLPQYGTTDVYLWNPDPETEKSLDNTDDRINHWLLIHLRSSPLDVNLLARTYESKFGPIQFLDDWQKNVLTLWYNDGTRKGVHAYRIYSSDGQSQVPPPASQQVAVGDGDQRAHSEPLAQDPTIKP